MAKNISGSSIHILSFADVGKNIQNLLQCSIEARKTSYNPYSNFAVGAALLCDNGEIYHGCNVENISYGITVCAEQTAIVKAISDGKTNFKAIAVSADAKEIVTPCGKCRQFIYEFGRDIMVYCAKIDLKEVLVSSSSDLLPNGFKTIWHPARKRINVDKAWVMRHMRRMDRLFRIQQLSRSVVCRKPYHVKAICGRRQ